MLSERSIQDIYSPSLRPSKKLVWSKAARGGAGGFIVVPAGDVAIMDDLTTGSSKTLSVIEGSGTNLVGYSSSFSTGQWAGTSVDREELTEDGIIPNPDTGAYLKGWRLTNTHASSGSVSVSHNYGALASGRTTFYAIARAGTSVRSYVGLRDIEENGWVLLVDYRWDVDNISINGSPHGSDSYVGRIKLTDDIVLIWGTTTPNNPTNTSYLAFYPGVSPGPGSYCDLYHMQIEKSAHFTSPVVTNAGPVTRLQDVFINSSWDTSMADDESGTIVVSFAYPMGFSPDLGFGFYEEYSSSTNRLLVYGTPGFTNGVRLYMRSSEAGRQNRILETTAPQTTEVQTIKISVDKTADKIAMVFNGEYKETTGANCWTKQLLNSRIGFSSYGNVWLHQVYRDKIPRFDQTLVDFIPPENPQ